MPITASQRSPGTFETPNWDQESLEGIRNALITVGETIDDSRGVWDDAAEGEYLVMVTGRFVTRIETISATE
ncbi:hypothetical protein C496_09786 [Natronorubrum tibetense GA33]|uniref:Uncharacterized protein n=1 Tax=Natronorubrum tibetense GA33 TaxID=1114856 RepID=L9VVQ8_9EURY|nr:hypothetical protein C496_09786 [Natronorubrum tibetense GA33]